MEPPYSISLFLILFASANLTEGNHQIALCENAYSTNISCPEEYVIVINDVNEPVRNEAEDGHAAVHTCLFDVLNSSKSYIETTCNNEQTCIVNTSLVDIASCENIERKFNITYRCEYEYVGCFLDDSGRLLQNRTQGDRNKPMSAKICSQLCLPYQSYFGTQYYYECFCGDGERIGTDPYRLLENSECNQQCRGHPDEMCGGYWRISVYNASPETQQLNSVTTTEFRSTNCQFAAAVTDINITSFQTSNECDTFQFEDQVLMNKFQMKENATDAIENYNLQFLPNFVIINYSCVAISIVTDHANFKADETGNTTVIVLGVCVGVLVPCAVTMIIFLMRRRTVKKADNTQSTSNLNRPSETVTDMVYDNIYVNSNVDKHDEQTYENSPQPLVDDSTDHIYQISTKHKKIKNKTDEVLNIPKHQERRDSASSDHYADHAEGVYDRAHQIQYKSEEGGQALYSHAVEDVYDTAEVQSRPQPHDGEDPYDQFNSQTN